MDLQTIKKKHFLCLFQLVFLLAKFTKVLLLCPQHKLQLTILELFIILIPQLLKQSQELITPFLIFMLLLQSLMSPPHETKEFL